MLLNLKSFENLLIDPINRNKVNLTSKKYKFISNLPVLINFKNSLIKKNELFKLKTNKSLIGNRDEKFFKKIKNLISLNELNTKKNIAIFTQKIKKNSIILIIGGGSRGSGLEFLYNSNNHKIIAFDIYPSTNIQFIADAHNIPLKNSSVDGVIIQAVLEHVLEPKTVVKEIYRVLKKNGLVFSETPFLQESHEEPFDFHRYTDLGHRWLFKDFDEVLRSTNGSQGLNIYWSIKSIFKAVFGDNLFSKLFSSPFIIFSLFDLLITNRRKIKGANGLIFIGRKTNKKKINLKNIINQFAG